MATKNDPGAYDCYANAQPDEPLFVLLARDPTGALLVGLWVALRAKLRPTDVAQIQEAAACANAMDAYAQALGKGEACQAAKQAFAQTAFELLLQAAGQMPLATRRAWADQILTAGA